MRRLAPALALGALLLLLASPASADCVVGHRGPCDDVFSSGGRGSATTAPPTTSTVPVQPTTTVPEQQPTATTSGVASEDAVPKGTVAATGEELPFTGTSAIVILAAAGVFLAAGAPAFFVARTKPKH